MAALPGTASRDSLAAEALGRSHQPSEVHYPRSVWDRDRELLRSNEKQLRGGLVFKARRLVLSLNSRPRVMKKKKKDRVCGA